VNSTAGGNVYLQCNSSDLSAKVQWSRRSGNLPNSSQVLEDGTLVLYRVSGSDAGAYICTATSKSGQVAQVEATLDLNPVGFK
jgi:hypothetical protein